MSTFPFGRWTVLPPRGGDSGNKFAVRPLLVHRVGQAPEEHICFDLTIKLTRADALNLAAWLECLADPGGEEIARLVKEIKQ